MSVGSFFKTTLPAMAVAVASEIPGPVGAVAQLVGKVIGKTVKPDGAEINSAVEGATPEQIIELKKNDQDFQVTMQKMGFEDLEAMAALAEKDRESARGREIAVKGWTTPALAWLIIAGTFSVIVTILFGWAKVEAALAGTLVGYVVAMCQQVVGYYFGSSAGSERKTELLATSKADVGSLS